MVTVNGRLSAVALIKVLIVKDAALISKTDRNTVPQSLLNDVLEAGRAKV